MDRRAALKCWVLLVWGMARTAALAQERKLDAIESLECVARRVVAASQSLGGEDRDHRLRPERRFRFG